MQTANGNGTIEISDSLKDVIKQLNEPQTASALKNLAKNAQVLDGLVIGVDGFLRRSEGIAENISESIREFAPKFDGNGKADQPQLMEEVPQLINNLPTLAKTGNKISALAETKEFDALLNKENLGTLQELVELVNKPETLEALREIMANAQVLALAVTALSAFLARSEEIAENIGESIREFAPKFDGEKTHAIGEVIGQIPNVLPPLMKNLPALTENLPALMEQMPSLMKTGAKVGEIAESEGIQAFLNSGMLTPGLVNFLGQSGKVVVQTEEEFRKNPKEVSLWGAYSEMKDKDVQRGLGFLLSLAKNFGQALK